MNGHECYIIGAGDFFRTARSADDNDYVIAADAGFEYCTENCIIPRPCARRLRLARQSAEASGTFCSFPWRRTIRTRCSPSSSDLKKGYRRFYIYGGLGGKRPDHTIANMQALLFLLSHGARGWLFGENYVWTAIKNSSLRIEGARVTLRYSALTAKQRAFR